MRRNHLAVFAGVTALSLLAVVPAVSVRAAAPAAHAHATVQVAIQNFAFSPQTITVAPGATVKWNQVDTTQHNVTSDNGAFPSSSNLSAGQSYSYTFTKPGTYSYHCSIHPTMVATIIVSSSGSSSGSGMSMMGPMGKQSMPVWTGFYDDHKVMYLSTDTSSKSQAAMEHINYAPALTKSLSSASLIYFVTNGAFASRGAIFGSQPGASDYTPLWQVVLVTWKDASKATALGSDNTISDLVSKGKLTITKTGTVLNCPIIKVMGK